MFYKRVFRELKASKVRYFFIFLILAVGMTMVAGNIMAADNVIDQMKEYRTEYSAEDGEFTTFFELSDDDLEKLNNKGVSVEKEFYLEYEQKDKSVLRVFHNRENMNRIKLVEGTLPTGKDEVVIENRYAQTHDLQTGSSITIAGKKMKVCGIGTVPDYVTIKRNLADLGADHKGFGLAFVSSDGYTVLSDTEKAIQSQTFQYAYILKGDYKDSDVKDYINDMEVPEEYKQFGVNSNLISFTKQADNNRMVGYETDLATTSSVCIMMGSLLAILFAFVISIFISHTIEQESVVIGTLYALGVKKNSLLKQYVLLPTLVIFFGGVVGLIVGYILCGASIQTGGASYSYPAISANFYPATIIYGVLLPVIFGFLVNVLMINRKLKMEPLDLLKKRAKQGKVSKLKLRNRKIISVFKIRQLLREKAIYIVLFIGVFYSIYILLFSFTIHSAIGNYVDTCVQDVKWNYMYTLKQMPDKVPDGAKAAYSQDMSGYNKYSDSDTNITVLGLDEKSSYFDFNTDCKEGEIIISDCVARKFDWKAGDSIKLKLVDKDDEEKTFKIKEVVDYSASLFAFMPIEDLREMYDADDDFYNVIFSKEKLDELDTDIVWNVIERKDISKMGESLMDSMSLTIMVLLVASIIVFIAVLYLLLKQAMEKSSFSIGLLKVFGYRNSETRKIFIDSNFWVVFIGALLSLVVGKPALDQIYPSMIADIELGLDTSFTPQTYGIIIAIIVVSYVVSMILLNRKLNKMDYTELLKDRE